MRKSILTIAIAVGLFSCQKEPVNRESNEFSPPPMSVTATWYHQDIMTAGKITGTNIYDQNKVLMATLNPDNTIRFSPTHPDQPLLRCIKNYFNGCMKSRACIAWFAGAMRLSAFAGWGLGCLVQGRNYYTSVVWYKMPVKKLDLPMTPLP